MLKTIKNDPKAFCRYSNSKLKTKPKLGYLPRQDGTLTSKDEEKACRLNDFFASVFTREDTTVIPTLPNQYNGHLLTEVAITEEEIKKKLNSKQRNPPAQTVSIPES